MTKGPSSSSDQALLRATHLTKVFADDRDGEVRALDDLSCTVMPGRIVGLVGADGSGKTTLLRCAAGLLTATDGTLDVLGYDSAEHPLAIQSRVGYMPQQFGLYEDLTVLENLTLYADLHSIPRHDRGERFDTLLSTTDLEDFSSRRAGALSGGMKQKLGLACALVRDPDLLLLDEPTVGVDPVSRQDIWSIIQRLIEEKAVGVLLSTAYLDEAEACHAVVLLHQGKSIAEGTPADFHDRVSGRIFVVAAEEGDEARAMQTDLAAQSQVVDATIRHGKVRVVVAKPAESEKTPRELLPEPYRERAREAEPTFEDAFMDAVPRSEDRWDSTDTSPDDDSRSESAEVVVDADGLVKRFGDFEAVKDISFQVRRGEIFAILGPNGAGKSTTFRMLCGLLPISDGRASVAGRDLRRSRAKARARLGYMAQTFSLYTQLTVLENFRFYGRAYGLGRAQLNARIDWALEDFALQDYKDRPAGSLPGGYKQRLAMATALLHEPDILFLDEPTSGVDPLARREFWIRIGRFARQGVTVVVTTHFMEEAEFCDRMLIMSRGEQLALGTPADIRALARSETNDEPSIEDAFIALAKGEVTQTAAEGGDEGESA